MNVTHFSCFFEGSYKHQAHTRELCLRDCCIERTYASIFLYHGEAFPTQQIDIFAKLQNTIEYSHWNELKYIRLTLPRGNSQQLLKNCQETSVSTTLYHIYSLDHTTDRFYCTDPILVENVIKVYDCSTMQKKVWARSAAIRMIKQLFTCKSFTHKMAAHLVLSQYS